MGKIGHSAGSDPPDQPKGLSQSRRIARKYEDRLSHDLPDRENPLEAPLVLLQAADGPMTDAIGVIVQYLDELSPEMQTSFDEDFDPEYINALRLMHSGLVKLRANIMPTREELDNISIPHDVFTEIADGVEGATLRAPISLESVHAIEENIIAPLRSVSESFLAGVDCELVRFWFVQLVGPYGQLHREQPPEPNV